MKLTRTDRGGVTTITVEGDLDIYTVPELRVMLVSLPALTPARVVLDLDRCDFLDITAIADLLGFVKVFGLGGGTLAFACTAVRPLGAFRTAGLLGVLDIYETVDLAVAALNAKEAGK